MCWLIVGGFKKLLKGRKKKYEVFVWVKKGQVLPENFGMHVGYERFEGCA